MAEKTTFSLIVNGAVESAEIPSCDSAFCQVLLEYGSDWTLLEGSLDDGLSQITRRSPGPDSHLVWNFPIDCAFKSSNAFGWPQLVLSIHEDGLGREMVKGYGCVHLPIAAGRYVRRVPLFKPSSASLVQHAMAYLAGAPAEYTDPKFPARGEGRVVTRVESVGCAYVALNVMTKDMGAFGYSEAPGPAPTGAADGFRIMG